MGASVDAAVAAPAPGAVWARSVGLEIEPLAELRLRKTLLARRTNFEKPLWSSSGAPDAAGAGVLILTGSGRMQTRRS